MVAPISTMEKLGVIPVLARTYLAALIRLVTAPFSAGGGAPNRFKDAMYAGFRTQFAITTIAQQQYMFPGTEENYLELARKEAFQPDSIVLPDGCKAHWLGPKNGEVILVYFHGGGYVLPCTPGHIKWLFDLTQSLSASHSVSSVLLGYTVAPGAQYPTQLRQAAELLDHLINKEGKRPENIIVAGDSAGGNLTLALMSHIMHPHPALPHNKLSLSSPLRAAVLISPWVKFKPDDASVTRNRNSDMINAPAAEKWSSAFIGDEELDEYNQPSMAGDDWFAGLDNVVGDLLVWGGGGEVLIDSIDAMVQKLKRAFSKTEYVVEPHAAHEDFIIAVLLGYKDKQQGTVVIENWIAQRL
ncbi:hypothetical protein LTR50_007811 [Elasticomyces elasticus]|nr:hypothetical protein LTR50_007811 [Elasticomyces elasticus]